MKFTLFEIVEDILNDISGDSVDSIADTIESMQVAKIVRSTYWYIVSQKNLPEHKDMFNLVESADTSAPVQMTLPSHVLTLDWINYDKYLLGATDSVWNRVEFVPWEQFLWMQSQLNEDDSNTTSMTVTTDNSDTWELKYRTDRHPDYWSTPDDYNIYFSSYNSTVDTDDYLYQEKTQCYGLIKPTFTLSDAFTPDLDATEFQMLIEEAKAAASVKLRQVRDPKAEYRARMGMIRMNAQSDNTNPQTALQKIKRYGRRK